MDPREFELLVDAHYGDVYRFAFSLARNTDDACDLTQQVFAIFAKKGGEIREKDRAKGWLFTTLYREFLRQGNRTRRVVCMDNELLDVQAVPVPDGTSRTTAHHELLEALASLDEPQRAILTLFYLDDRPYKDIADLLEIPIGTVMSRLSRAKAALRARMEDPPAKGINPNP